MRAAFTEQLGLKATAILVALLLWLVVSVRQPIQGSVSVRVMPALDSSLVLLGPPPQLEALVAGSAVDLVKLRAEPPAIYRKIDGDVPDTLVLDVTPADVRLPADLVDRIRILDVQPRNVALRFGARMTRRVRVLNEGRILVKNDGGMSAIADSVQFEPAMVRVSGPRRFVRRLDGVRPYSLTIARGDTLRHVADLDTNGLGVRVLPAQVKVVMRRATPTDRLSTQTSP